MEAMALSTVGPGTLSKVTVTGLSGTNSSVVATPYDTYGNVDSLATFGGATIITPLDHDADGDEAGTTQSTFAFVMTQYPTGGYLIGTYNQGSGDTDGDITDQVAVQFQQGATTVSGSESNTY